MPSPLALAQRPRDGWRQSITLNWVDMKTPALWTSMTLIQWKVCLLIELYLSCTNLDIQHHLVQMFSNNLYWRRAKTSPHMVKQIGLHVVLKYRSFSKYIYISHIIGTDILFKAGHQISAPSTWNTNHKWWDANDWQQADTPATAYRYVWASGWLLPSPPTAYRPFGCSTNG